MAALAVGIATQVDGDRSGREATGEAPVTHAQTSAELQAGKSAADSAAPESMSGSEQGATPPPSTTRLQDYRAELRIRVASAAEVSRATAQAMRTARSLGGYVVSAQLDRPDADDGDSVLVFRVPVSRSRTRSSA